MLNNNIIMSKIKRESLFFVHFRAEALQKNRLATCEIGKRIYISDLSFMAESSGVGIILLDGTVAQSVAASHF